MKKWLDDLYAILLKHGFHTLDNVLEVGSEDYEEKQIYQNINLTTNESITLDLIDIADYLNLYDRFSIFNRGFSGSRNFLYSFYKSENDFFYLYNVQNSSSNDFRISFDGKNKLTITNGLSADLRFSVFIKKSC